MKFYMNYIKFQKTLPDDKNVIAIMYGPTLLAFESASEVILKGNTNTILNSISVVDNSNNSFYLKNNGKTWLLRPLYDIEDQSYGVYATIRNY